MITMKLVGLCEQARRVLILESVLSAVLFSCFFFSVFFVLSVYHRSLGVYGQDFLRRP